VTPGRVEDLLRELAPQVLGALARRHGQFDQCEDAVQEALLAAAVQWPAEGLPRNPAAWLTTVAQRSLVDHRRSDGARRRREEALAALEVRTGPAAADPGGDGPGHGASGTDDTLTLFFLCCHPSLPPRSQLALTLRAVGGLTTAEIAAAFLVPPGTMARRIHRAKQGIRDAGTTFTLPAPADRAARLDVVRQALYLMFNEGYTASSGAALQRPDLTAEAIRLTRLLRRAAPQDGETGGLLALMLLTDARRAARTDAHGAIVPLADQRRDLWDRDDVAEGLALLHRTLGAGPVGPFQVQAAIAAVHAEATDAEATDWPQILALYDVLTHVAPGPLVTLSRAVALAMVHGPRAGLAVVGTLDDAARTAHTHRVAAVRAHLLELAGDADGARRAYLTAARRTASLPEQRYLRMRAAALRAAPGG
jgi:RNA polymerase sigma factor (sigma-70 family)